MSVAAAFGNHLLADLRGADAARLGDLFTIEAALLAAAATAGATVVGHAFHHFGEQQGVTGVVLLRESHISIHTWPEQRFAALDVFMCGDAQPYLAVQHIARVVEAANVRVEAFSRGG